LFFFFFFQCVFLLGVFWGGFGLGGGGGVNPSTPRYATGCNILSVSKYNNLSATYPTF